MAKNTKVTLYTIRGLAQKLGMDYGTLRNMMMKIRKGEIHTYKGYRFFGEPNKQWYAYDEHTDIEIIGLGNESN